MTCFTQHLNTRTYQSICKELSEIPEPISSIEQNKTDCLWVTSNELYQERTIAYLKKNSKEGAVLGVSGLYTLDLAAASKKPTAIFLFDLAESVNAFWEDILPILKKTAERSIALEEISNQINIKNASYYRYHPQVEDPKIHSQKEVEILNKLVKHGRTSFLSSDESYTKIHALAKEGRIFFKMANLLDDKTVFLITQCFEKYKVIFSVIYLSNIADINRSNKRDLPILLLKNNPAGILIEAGGSRFHEAPIQTINTNPLKVINYKELVENLKKTPRSCRKELVILACIVLLVVVIELLQNIELSKKQEIKS